MMNVVKSDDWAPLPDGVVRYVDVLNLYRGVISPKRPQESRDVLSQQHSDVPSPMQIVANDAVSHRDHAKAMVHYPNRANRD